MATIILNYLIGRYKNVRELEDAILNLLYDSTVYANMISNINIVNPTITGSNAKIEPYDSDRVKIGPFQLNGSTNIINKIEVKRGESVLTLDSLPYLLANSTSQTNTLPKAGEKFYLIVKNFNVNSTSNATVSIYYNYKNYTNIKLYEATKINDEDGIQPILIAEGSPEVKKGSSSVTIDIAEPTNYTISLYKKDTIFHEPVPNAEFNVKLSNGTTKTMTTNSNGVASITLNADSIGTENITITETKVGNKWKLLSSPITLKVTKIIENNKYIVSSITPGTSLPSGTDISYNKANATITINAQDPTNLNPGKYTIDFNKLDSTSKEKLSGAVFDMYINGIPVTIRPNSDGSYRPVSIDITEEGIDTIQIKEVSAPDNYKKLNGTLILEITKKADKASWSYQATDVKITKKFKDENGKDIDVVVMKHDKNSHTIKLDIQNEREIIKLSGYVWEDEKQGKESALNGMKDRSEKYINGITVTCYSMDGKNILYTNSNTKTAITGMKNKDGYYEFEVPKTKEGYYIGFTYNGQNYQHTKYTKYDGKNSSNATENNQDRRYINSLLEEIHANKIVENTKINNKINEQDATYTKDSCYKITAYTGDRGNHKSYIKTFNTTSEHIDLGITKREMADLAIRKDVYKTTLSIKGKTQDYIYNRRENLETDANGNSYWDIKVRQSDNYYKDNYSREIRTSDYNYQGENELTAEVVYKIIVRNQSGLIDTKLTELVDYYDNDYIYKEAYILDNNTKRNIIPSQNSKYGLDNHNTTINGYQKIYLDMADITIKANSQVELYVVFGVNTDNNGKLLMDLDENNLGKGNIVEVMGYKTYYTKEAIPPNYGSKITDVEYREGDIAGRIDIDSNPGNTISENENNFEDDTDKAPYIRFSFAQTGRSVKGTVWKDNRTELEANAATGNGIKDNGEVLIDGVTVELWDMDTNSIAQIWNGTKWVEAKTTSNKDDGYEISNFVPGNYYIKFTYKDGQNYKSTVFNYDKVLKTTPDKRFDVDNPDDLTFEYNETTDQNYSDARDIWGNESTPGTRAYVNNKYTSEGIITNRTENKLNEELERGDCSIQAITGTISVNFEADSNNTNSDSGRLYELNNIDLGLQERPKAQLMITKEINNVKVILANGSILFDANGKATNVMWHDKKTHTNGYNRNLMNEPQIVDNNPQVLLTMDSELMHGANIKINYKISVKNIGEVDYTSKQFYYTGKKLSEDEAATTTVYDIVDYAGASGSEGSKISINNLKFSANENSGWIPVTASELKQQGLVHIVDNNNDITNKIDKYSTILKYSFGENGSGKELKPQIEKPDQPNEYSTETYLTLLQVMTSDNKDDDLKYGNMVEILSLKNSMGRIQYSTVGNQNPNDNIKEVDADLSQLTILPPFGDKNIYYVLGIGIAIICISGIIIIKKKVLNK